MNITVTKPFLPPIEEFIDYIEKIWETHWLTNNGQFHIELEKELAKFLEVPYVCLFANGSLALVTALQCLRITGEVITTPFSFVATTHSLWWNNIKPVFVDIDPIYGNLNPDCIEAAITPSTTAIMPVHVYGNPCDNEKIDKIANTYGLKIIYDGAHAFHVRKDGNSILNWGSLSVLSFHATKVFTTFEGGAIVCHDLTTKKRLDDLKNFGIHDELTVVAPGINAKMNEVQAAFGLLQLKYIDLLISKRKVIASIYRKNLQNVKGIRMMHDIEGVEHNYSYFPIFINQDFRISRDGLYDFLKSEKIFTRRYFYPLISNFPTYQGNSSAKAENLPVATEMAKQVLCLPIYPELDLDTVHHICKLIKGK